MVSKYDMSVLAAKIFAFLEKYAGISPNYDEEWDDPEDRWTGPDASELNAVAEMLARGEIPTSKPRSSWGSGTYKPFNSVEGKEKHDELCNEVNNLIDNN